MLGARIERLVSGALYAIVLVCGALAKGVHRAPDANQHSYMLHAMARQDPALAGDWTAGTADPFPIFTFLSSLALSLCGPVVLRVVELAFWVLFFWGLTEIAVTRFRPGKKISVLGARIAVVSCLGLLVSEAFWEGVWSVGGPPLGLLSRVVMNGFGYQFIGGSAFEPASFGVLLLLGIVAQLRGLWTISAVLAGFAGAIHPTYLLPAGLLVLVAGYKVWSGPDRRPAALGMTLLAPLLIVLPTVVYTTAHFAGFPEDVSQMATAILAQERLPHHALPSRWGLVNTGLQIGLMIVAVIVLWSTRARTVVMIWLITALLGLLAVLITSSNTLALLFPWRATTVLVPVGVALIVGGIVVRLGERVSFASPWSGSLVLTLALIALAGTSQATTEHSYAARSASFSDARLLVEKAPDDATFLVQPGWQWFRLMMRRPVYVDWKTHPFAAPEVVEWQRRLSLATQVWEAPPMTACAAMREIGNRGHATHAILSSGRAAALLACLEPTSILRPAGVEGVLIDLNGVKAPAGDSL